eukprot:gene3885-4429_t
MVNLIYHLQRNCASEQVVLGIRSIDDVGQRQYEKYVENVLEKRNTSFLAPIKKSKIVIFRSKSKKEMSLKLRQVKELKNDRNLMSRMLVGIHGRGGSLDEFFTHENQPSPPSLSEQGELRLPKAESELFKCLQQQPAIDERGHEEECEDADRNYIAEDDSEDNSANENHVPVIVISDSEDEEHDEDNDEEEDHDNNDIIEIVDSEEQDIENEGSNGIDHNEEHERESEEMSQQDVIFREFDFSMVTFFVHLSGCPHSHEE